MIGSITEVGEAALFLGPTLEQMCWPRDDDGSYSQLREEADARLRQMGIEEIALPPDQAEYLERAGAVNLAVLEHLSAERGKVNGDVVGLPLFVLTTLAYRSVIGMLFDNPDQQHVEQVEDCLEDLGVRRDLVQVLEREVGRIGLEAGEDGEPSASFGDLILAGGGFVVRVLEEFGRSEPDLARLEDLVATIDNKVTTLGSDLGDFRAESKERDTRIEQLVIEGNAEVIAALEEVKSALVTSGQVDAAQAEALTEGDPQGFWDRLQRWGANTPARDAAEQALWAALDFVPAGSAVKLGFKVAEAIRRSLKASGAGKPRGA